MHTVFGELQEILVFRKVQLKYLSFPLSGPVILETRDVANHLHVMNVSRSRFSVRFAVFSSLHLQCVFELHKLI